MRRGPSLAQDDALTKSNADKQEPKTNSQRRLLFSQLRFGREPYHHRIIAHEHHGNDALELLTTRGAVMPVLYGCGSRFRQRTVAADYLYIFYSSVSANGHSENHLPGAVSGGRIDQ